MSEYQDPRTTIAKLPMSRLQIGIVICCMALNAMDGFDVLAISFAAPGISDEWGINRAVLGRLLSMELIGMAVGSILMGNLADRFGRRPIILTCLSIMAGGMFLSAIADNITMLSAVRLLTGLGIGGMLSATSAMVAEFSNERRHGLTTILNIAGYAIGAIVGGTVASILLAKTGEWRSVFLFGGTMTLMLLPIAFLFLPESIHSQISRRRPNALQAINKTLARMKIAAIDRLPEPSIGVEKPSILSLFTQRYAGITLVLTIAYFAQIMAFYFIQKWTPKIVVDLGFEASSAGSVLVFANIGSLLGALTLGLASSRINMRYAVMFSMVMAFIFFGLYGMGHKDLSHLSLFAAITIFFTNAGVVGMYPILAKAFPAELRASGTGFVIGMGRGGAALGPIIAGSLFQGGSSLLVVSLVMGAGTLVAATMIFILPFASRRANAA
ncbi:MAG: MFS transporter [Alphaproteobacteria bacterium]|nr:MAG: MFS transporter [Alphaproteobacteria bacterium]